MAYRLIIEENTIYEIDEECERMLRMTGTHGSAYREEHLRKYEAEPEGFGKTESKENKKDN